MSGPLRGTECPFSRRLRAPRRKDTRFRFQARAIDASIVEWRQHPPVTVALRLESVQQLIGSKPPSIFHSKTLDEEAEEFILEELKILRNPACVRLVIYLPQGEISMTRGLEELLRGHFVFRREQARRRLAEMWRFGRRSLLLGFAALSIMLLLVEAINQTLPGGPLSSSVREGLTILGWVALWRPAEIVLYEWRPLKRDLRLFEALEHLRLEIAVWDESSTTVDNDGGVIRPSPSPSAKGAVA